jgi:hypothetical protein
MLCKKRKKEEVVPVEVEKTKEVKEIIDLADSPSNISNSENEVTVIPNNNEDRITTTNVTNNNIENIKNNIKNDNYGHYNTYVDYNSNITYKIPQNYFNRKIPPTTIEFINLDDPEDYTISSFNFAKNNEVKKNKKVAKKGCTSANAIFDNSLYNLSAENEVIDLGSDSDPDQNELETDGKIVNNLVEPSYSNKDRILIYSTTDKVETCDIEWVNTIDNQPIPKWNVSFFKNIFFFFF